MTPAESETQAKNAPQIRSLHDELHPQFRRGQWIAQRVGWGIMAAVLLLATVGLFGSGPISRDTISSSNERANISLEYERWTRRLSDNDLRIRINAPDAGEGVVALTIDPSFARDITLQEIAPPADRTSLTTDGARYEWSASGDGEMLIKLTYQPDRWRSLTGRIVVEAAGESRSLEFKQFVFP